MDEEERIYMERNENEMIKPKGLNPHRLQIYSI
jgi:hypothetical protein